MTQFAERSEVLLTLKSFLQRIYPPQLQQAIKISCRHAVPLRENVRGNDFIIRGVIVPQ